MDISLSVEAVAVAIAVGYLLEKQIINVAIITNRHEWSGPGSRASESIPCRRRSAVVHARRAFAQSHTVGGQLANQALETQLGTELFKRSTTNVALSAAGEGLVGYARRILMLGDEAVQRLKQHRMEGRVRLGVMDDYGALILPPILKSFSNLYPGIELQMETGLTSGMVGRLGRAYDIVIAMHEAGEQTGEFLRREQAVWAGPASINPKDLDPLPVALYPTGCLFRKWALDAVDRAGRE
jgi:DNA-binding transcriptional LysR family regulator